MVVGASRWRGAAPYISDDGKCACGGIPHRPGRPPGESLTRDAKGPLLACDVGLYRFNAEHHRFEPCPDYGAALADGSLAVRSFTPDDQGGLWLVVVDVHAETSDDFNAPHLVYGRNGKLIRLTIPPLVNSDDPSHLLHESANNDGRPETLWMGGQSAEIIVVPRQAGGVESPV
ncbi:MAG: hypothetical protein J6386_09260 [Candidatus Synoicihabitans palmerolidicus]|nr:hypothetical protein [Candidatus Synoicihabitans palmerolidicus]